MKSSAANSIYLRGSLRLSVRGPHSFTRKGRLFLLPFSMVSDERLLGLFSFTSGRALYDGQAKRFHSTCSTSNGLVMSGEDIRDLFYSRPPAEQVAAIYLAKACIKRDQASDTADNVSSEQEREKIGEKKITAAATRVAQSACERGSMRLKDFAEGMPDATRDAVFQGGCALDTWIKQGKLLKLRYLNENGEYSDAPLTPPEDGVPHYGPLRFVCLTVPPERLLEEAADTLNRDGDSAGTRNPKQKVEASDGGALHGGVDAADNLEEGNDGQREVRSAKEITRRNVATYLASAAGRNVLFEGLHHVIAKRTAIRQETALSQTLFSYSMRYLSLNDAYNSFMRFASEQEDGTDLKHLARHTQFDHFEDALLQREPRDKTEEGGDHDEDENGDGFRQLKDDAATKFWLYKGQYIANRLEGEEERPVFLSPQPQTSCANSFNNYGGWATVTNVPTKEDVYEMLKYIPVNWGNFGSINIPPAMKKRHIRVSSSLQWFRRQPYYFELRNMAGTTEIRRSVLLHPEAHGMTQQEALEYVQYAIATGEANNLEPLGPDGRPLSVQLSASQQLQLKFFLRVCPGYFVPLSLLMQRYTKKNLTEEELFEFAKRYDKDFEIYRPKYIDKPLVRRRIGADSSRWRAAFVADFERHPEDARGMVAIMNRLIATWDKPHYVYVRLDPIEQQAVGGYEGMVTILKRHPEIFRWGNHFVMRADSSDPTATQEAEPAEDDTNYRVFMREENPYLSPTDLAAVFHYVAPTDEPCTAAYFVQCSSPAMRVVLPPRIITILQAFPTLFTCKETSPGVFSIMRRNKQRCQTTSMPSTSATNTTRSSGVASSTTSSTSNAAATDEEGIEDADFEAEMAAEENMTREELLDAVKNLIPEKDGVELSQLLLWASMAVQRAANARYGGIGKMVEQEKGHFLVEDKSNGKMVLLGSTSTSAKR